MTAPVPHVGLFVPDQSSVVVHREKGEEGRGRTRGGDAVTGSGCHSASDESSRRQVKGEASWVRSEQQTRLTHEPRYKHLTVQVPDS